MEEVIVRVLIAVLLMLSLPLSVAAEPCQPANPAGWDALHGSSVNIYSAPPHPAASPAVQWRTRF
jgi:hypothetical protein